MALKIDIIQVATAMHELAKAVRAVHVRISIDEMFDFHSPSSCRSHRLHVSCLDCPPWSR